jgi:hypothetical protein
VVVGRNEGFLSADTRSWELKGGQILRVGRFLARAVDQILVQDSRMLMIAVLAADGSGFQPALTLAGSIGGWELNEMDVLTPANLDQDPQAECLARRGRLFGVLDFGNPPRSLFVGRLASDPLRFEIEPTFLRGDVNGDKEVDISDAVTILSELFLGGQKIDCQDGADADDNGSVNISDAVYLLVYLFNRGLEPPAPGTSAPGIDPTPDALGCLGKAP